MPENMMTIVMLVVVAALIFFMFRNSRKRAKATQDLQSKVVPGAEVMTNFGVFGTIVSIDAEENKVQLETSPGNVLTVHRQTISRVIDPVAVEDEPKAELNADHAIQLDGEPEYGERVENTDETSHKKIDE